MASYLDVIEGLKILAAHDPKGVLGQNISAEHDEICAGSAASADAIGEADKKRLEALGWHWSREVESWKRFV